MSILKRIFGSKKEQVQKREKYMNEKGEIKELETTESQEKRILKYLKDGNTLTQLEALKLFDCFRLSGRIFNLRNDGHKIETNIIKVGKNKKVAQYKLIK